MPFHEGFPQNLSEYMESEGKKIAEEVEQRQETGEIQEQEGALFRQVQPDLLEQGRRLLEKKIVPPQKGYTQEQLGGLLRDEKALDDFGVQHLPGRETQARDLVAALLRDQGENVVTPGVTRKETERRAFLESLAIRTTPEEEELARLRGETQGVPEVAPEQEIKKDIDAPAATEQPKPEQEEGEEKTPEETLKEKLQTLKDTETAASGREGSQEYADLAGQQARVADVLQRQREIFDVAKEKKDAGGMSLAAREIERLEREHTDLDQKINVLPPDQLPGKLEPLLHVKDEQQLSREEFAGLIEDIQTRKGPKTPTNIEQALIDDFQKREGETLEKEAQERGKEEFLKVLQEKYEVLGRMAGNERNEEAVTWAKEAAELGEMRMAQDLLSRCNDRPMREAGLRDIALTLAEKGIDDPELLKWVELGISGKKFRGQTMIDVTNAKQKRLLREQLEAQEVDPKTAEKLLNLVGNKEKLPTMEQANKKWEKVKDFLKSDTAKQVALGVGIGAGAAGATFGILMILQWLFAGAIAAGIFSAWRYSGSRGKKLFF